MILTEKYLIVLLSSRKRELIENANFFTCDDCNQDQVEQINKEIKSIDNVLNGKETITLANDSIWEYFKGILKI